METMMTIVAGILLAVGTYLVLTKSLMRIIIGTAIFAHGSHLMLLTMAGLKRGSAPLLGEGAATYTDPLPQALILTAIVISFALTAFLLVLGYRTFTEHQTDDMDQLRGQEYE